MGSAGGAGGGATAAGETAGAGSGAAVAQPCRTSPAAAAASPSGSPAGEGGVKWRTCCSSGITYLQTCVIDFLNQPPVHVLMAACPAALLCSHHHSRGRVRLQQECRASQYSHRRSSSQHHSRRSRLLSRSQCSSAPCQPPARRCCVVNSSSSNLRPPTSRWSSDCRSRSGCLLRSRCELAGEHEGRHGAMWEGVCRCIMPQFAISRPADRHV